MIFGLAIFSGRADLKISSLDMSLSRLKIPREETGYYFSSRLARAQLLIRMLRLTSTVLLLILDGCCDISNHVFFWTELIR